MGRSERGAGANSGGDKGLIAEARNSSGPPLDRGREGEYYFGVGGKTFLGGPKNNQLLNATVTGKLFQKQSSVGRWQPEEVIENAELNPGLLRSWGPYPL